MENSNWSLKIIKRLGYCNIIFAIIGLGFNLITITNFFRESYSNPTQPYLVQSVIVMTSIAIVFNILLLINGIQLIKQKIIWIYGLIGIFILEFFYLFFIGILWGALSKWPLITHSVAGATGISNGSVSFLFMTLYPLWGTALGIIAKMKYEKLKNATIV